MDFTEFDREAQMGLRKDHPVIPHPTYVSKLAIEAASQAIESSGEYGPSLIQLALSNDHRARQLNLPISKGADIVAERETLERAVTVEIQGNFTISKAKTMDNLPEKAQANQRAQILSKTIDDRYVADNYYP